ncbi:sulfatase-like hydrolase/transferase [Microlunatus speluncae]|uniref:sulfatase-like hydrolase/transferase n=1 Tax=Microlunatus speluncae TaxID=2594267 RepID=UPI00126673C4|nr:sulfatase-like hydrolase/transferase [Microlunatus speluncae]
MTAPNLVVVLSDEHAAAASGFAGHPRVRTPRLDRLAGESQRFDNAYCGNPICVPSRLSLLSGRYPHQVEAWDNGAIPGPDFRSWGHHLRPAGYRCVIAGRTHFNGPDRLLGFDRRLSDDLGHWLTPGAAPRRTPEARRESNSHVSEVGAGHDVQTRYDELTTELAAEFLTREAARPAERPFLLYVGYMHPHFPLVAPPEDLARYDPADVELPPDWRADPADQHPVIAQLRRFFRNDEPLTEDQLRRATVAYWALISHLDRQVGRVLDMIDSGPLRDNTAVLYTSDHGEMAGRHGIWQKQCFYQDSVRVPLLLRLPESLREAGAPAVITDDVSHLDVLPTLRELAGLPADPDLPGRSLRAIARDGSDRPVFAEYHAQGMLNAGFMIKQGRYKLCEYVSDQPQLFDLDADPDELTDLAADPAQAEILARLRQHLRTIADPAELDRRAKEDQQRRRSR